MVKDLIVRGLVGLCGLVKMFCTGCTEFLIGFTDKNIGELVATPVTFVKEVVQEVRDLSRL